MESRVLLSAGPSAQATEVATNNAENITDVVEDVKQGVDVSRHHNDTDHLDEDFLIAHGRGDNTSDRGKYGDFSLTNNKGRSAQNDKQNRYGFGGKNSAGRDKQSRTRGLFRTSLELSSVSQRSEQSFGYGDEYGDYPAYLSLVFARARENTSDDDSGKALPKPEQSDESQGGSCKFVLSKQEQSDTSQGGGGSVGGMKHMLGPDYTPLPMGADESGERGYSGDADDWSKAWSAPISILDALINPGETGEEISSSGWVTQHARQSGNVDPGPHTDPVMTQNTPVEVAYDLGRDPWINPSAKG